MERFVLQKIVNYAQHRQNVNKIIGCGLPMVHGPSSAGRFYSFRRQALREQGGVLITNGFQVTFPLHG